MSFSVTAEGLEPPCGDVVADRAHRVDQFDAPAVVDAHRESEHVVAGGELLGVLQLFDDRAPQAGFAARPAHPHAPLVELIAAAVQDVAVEPHEEAHLVGRACPVLRRERVHAQVLHARLDRAGDDIEQRRLARLVALRPGSGPAGSPSARCRPSRSRRARAPARREDRRVQAGPVERLVAAPHRGACTASGSRRGLDVLRESGCRARGATGRTRRSDPTPSLRVGAVAASAMLQSPSMSAESRAAVGHVHARGSDRCAVAADRFRRAARRTCRAGRALRSARSRRDLAPSRTAPSRAADTNRGCCAARARRARGPGGPRRAAGTAAACASASLSRSAASTIALAEV